MSRREPEGEGGGAQPGWPRRFERSNTTVSVPSAGAARHSEAASRASKAVTIVDRAPQREDSSGGARACAPTAASQPPKPAPARAKTRDLRQTQRHYRRGSAI